MLGKVKNMGRVGGINKSNGASFKNGKLSRSTGMKGYG
jgi:hypothetical protein